MPILFLVKGSGVLDLWNLLDRHVHMSRDTDSQRLDIAIEPTTAFKLLNVLGPASRGTAFPCSRSYQRSAKIVK